MLLRSLQSFPQENISSLLSTNTQESSQASFAAKIGPLLGFLSTWLYSQPQSTIQAGIAQGINDNILFKEASAMERTATTLVEIMGTVAMIFKPEPSQVPSSLRIDTLGAPCFPFNTFDLARGMMSFVDVIRGLGSPLPMQHDNDDDIEDANDVLDCDTLNLAYLVDTRRVKVEFTACVAAHMDFDRTNRILFIFNMPSFCLLQGEFGILDG